MSKVFKGVNEFNVELMELLISVCANANRNIGKKFPKSPAPIIGMILFFLTLNNSLHPMLNKKIEVKIIRNAPN